MVIWIHTLIATVYIVKTHWSKKMKIIDLLNLVLGKNLIPSQVIFHKKDRLLPAGITKSVPKRPKKFE